MVIFKQFSSKKLQFFNENRPKMTIVGGLKLVMLIERRHSIGVAMVSKIHHGQSLDNMIKD